MSASSYRLPPYITRAALVGALIVCSPLVIPLPTSADLVSEVDLKHARALDEATQRGLAWLAKAQLDDGSFQSTHKGTSAALAVMAFMAKGHTAGLGPYGDVINRGIDHVLDSQTLSKDHRNGMIAPDGRMYGHNMATLMLSQVSGMVDPERQKRVDDVLSKALKLTLSAQQMQKSAANQGGWHYEPNQTTSDMSHTGWAFMAIRSARNAGCAVPEEAIQAGVEYIRRCNSGGGFGYTPGAGPSLPLSGAGLLCLELTGHHRQEITIKAGDFILKQGANYGGHIYYALYYCSQGMFQLGGEHWEKYAPLLYDYTLKRQHPDGSFAPTGPGPAYSTAMAVLALSPSYRQLPIYQR
ncbi:MAG: terpene cyclase/mutase family protein [Verrucomicrobia bacterium]|nr:terpene cyclase/mutase family protein [Verrucomicrobiota bacterium]MDA1086661.1 terpene cyclase/mutase family protein [Verrucomicrobiota bacterium]